ncbi:hypothetical protein Syun_019607 [Stephania yunnanensis]|uniref:Uncharacterized protein n=1 Tax=Stephania yunnanensis TaxID=152371 RepID=A0AAP0NY51_9MAGN
MAALLSAPPTNNPPIPSQNQWLHSTPNYKRCSLSTKAKPLYSSTPSSSVQEQVSTSSSSSSSNSDQDVYVGAEIGGGGGGGVPLRGCKACGREEVEKGCNGEGRIQGGIATVPGFGWWPIKAFRPCPAFVASGGRYKRRGQSMDEVAGGRAGKGSNKADSR